MTLHSEPIAVEVVLAHANPIQIQKYLKRVDYPATTEQLIKSAKNLGADENVCASLEQFQLAELPEGVIADPRARAARRSGRPPAGQRTRTYCGRRHDAKPRQDA